MRRLARAVLPQVGVYALETGVGLNLALEAERVGALGALGQRRAREAREKNRGSFRH